MILFQNNLIILDYEPSTDILTVEWPNIEVYQLLEVREALRILVEYVKNYDVKKLLIDASNTKDNPELFNSEEYKNIMAIFVYDLSQTRLIKSALIPAPSKERKERSKKLIKELTGKSNLQIQNQEFTNKEEAQKWLLFN